MNIVIKVVTFIVIVSIIGIIYLQTSEKEIPKFENTWWGPGAENPDVDKSIKPFKIEWNDEAIKDLKTRLNRTRDLVQPLEGAAWTYGISGPYLKEKVLSYWLNKYDFKAQLAHLNKFPQFTTNIQGLNIRFLHVKPKNTKGKRVLPLIILHGWPGSTAEFYKVIPMLTTPREDHDFVFEVIAPSLPGFGFSDATVRPGLGDSQIAVVLKNLMLRLGFDKYYVHGGDWGAIITARMSALFPDHVIGMHSTMCTASSAKVILKIVFYSFFPSLLLEEEDYHWFYPLSERLGRILLLSGYLHLQATKPDSLGVGLADSPAALAAYVLEKFSDATNRDNMFKEDGGLFEKFTPNELIDNLMMYWMPNKMTTAMRIYAESFNKKQNTWLEQWPVEVPSACAQFPHEIIWYPREFLQERFLNLVQVTKMPRGGHFATLEEPELAANDIYKFVGIVEEQSEKRKKSAKKTDL
ncbi:juvenile hormone epoxide hydrolase 1 [Diachasma alloeum]|uniref:juvenile hormone epoxide hydrolase 1 n=1 Tax=Diachasma alloeum TaxID=454923 RepID=UPI0007381870|nr:juvenile hormone epoxide hydrolase 1 [Diachasma alloeum]